ncbi:MAG: tetratricopeptide repeat protein [Bacteroidota bacterium]
MSLPVCLIILFLHNRYVVDEFNKAQPVIHLSKRMIFVSITALTAILVVVFVVFITDYILTGKLNYLIAKDEYSVSKYKSAGKYYSKSASWGNVNAMVSLGNMYLQGKGVAKDPGKAKSLFLDAASKGNAEAMCELGILLLEEKGAETDYDAARKYFENASLKNYAKAQYRLGTMYMEGKGADKDLEKAKELFRKASLKNNEAKLELLIIGKQDEIAGLDKEKDKEQLEKCILKLQALSGIKEKNYEASLKAFIRLLSVMDRKESGYKTAIKKISQLDELIRRQEEKPAGKKK